MDPYVSKLCRFPLKGARGVSERALSIDSGIGVIGDRRYAIRRTARDTPIAWAPKGAFWVSMNRSEMAMECPSIAPDGAIEPEYFTYLVPWLGGGQMVDTENRFTMTDTNGPRVSIVNTASIRELMKHCGHYIDGRRFRMNVWVEGLEPFKELEWIAEYPGTREIRIGSMRFRLDDVCERCKAIEANPETGSYDLDVQRYIKDMMQSIGYRGSPHRGSLCVMGVLAQPLEHGVISCGDTITLL